MNLSTQHFAPNWSADELVAAVPAKRPPLHSFAFKLPANAAQPHRPSRHMTRHYVAQTALPLFRVAL
jgi:hypothetical protein